MIHRFSYDTGVPNQPSSEQFAAAAPSFRSDVEQLNPMLQIHDNESVDLLTARRLADEVINVSGAAVKVFVRTDNADVDPVWDADPDPTYWSPFPIKAFFKPQPLEVELKKWGLDTKNTSDVTFSHRQIYDRLGERMLRAGDVIQLPYNSAVIKPKNFRVTNATPAGNFRYHWLYLTCQVETLTADVTVRPEEDMPVETPDKPEARYVEGA